MSSMSSQTFVPCGIKFYGLLQNYFDKKFGDFNIMDIQFCAQCCDDIISIQFTGFNFTVLPLTTNP